MVESGEVSAANACEAIRKHGDKAQEFLAAQFEGAKQSGKKKLTKRTITPKRDLVAEGIAWIKETSQSPDTTDERLAGLLAFLTKAKQDDILAALNK